MWLKCLSVGAGEMKTNYSHSTFSGSPKESYAMCSWSHGGENALLYEINGNPKCIGH